MCKTIHVLKVAFLKFDLKSLVPRKKLPSSFRTPWPLGSIIEKVFIPRSWTSYGSHTPGSQLLQFSYSRQFPSALVPGIKNDRSLKFKNTLKRYFKLTVQYVVFISFNRFLGAFFNKLSNEVF